MFWRHLSQKEENVIENDHPAPQKPKKISFVVSKLAGWVTNKNSQINIAWSPDFGFRNPFFFNLSCIFMKNKKDLKKIEVFR